jgi:putative ABC transport system permease protein
MVNVAAAPTIYVPFAQGPGHLVVVLARTRSAAPQAIAAALKADIHAIDANQPVRGGQSMRQIIERSMGGFDMTTLVVGVVALTLASVGMYGVVAYSVARRTREIAIRVALGAAPGRVTRLVLGEGARIALVGGVPGLLLAAGAGRLLASKLHLVRAFDPMIFGVVLLVVVATVTVASYVPARRAARVAVTVATRAE